jgi:ABC-type transport system involved in multi-copper enzyme maturation permease subunit
MRWRRAGLGPVFVYEWLTAARRWQMYALRSAAATILLVAVYLMWTKAVPSGGYAVSHSDHAKVGEALFYGFFGTLISVVLLVAPAATAGAVCVDKARGTLLHLLVTDLSNWEIVWGKLAARLIPVLGLIAASVPVLTLCTLLGGIDPEAMLTGYGVIIGVAFFGSALALLLSVWGRKTHEVLLAAYLVEVLIVVAYPLAIGIEGALLKRTVISGRLLWTNPYVLVFSPYSGGALPFDVVVFLIVMIGGGVVLALVGAWRLRAAAIRVGALPRKKRAGKARHRSRSLRPFAPKMDPNPVLWREWHRQRPTRWTRAVWLIYTVLAVAATGILVFLQVTRTSEPALSAFTTGLQVSVGLLLASVSAVTALAEERIRGSMDVLLTTPLPTSSIVYGKWRGSFRRIPLLAILPAMNVVLLAWHTGRYLAVGQMIALVLAYGAAITSLGLLLATWIQRLSRAIAASAVIYMLITAGWLFLLATVTSRSHDVFESLGLASPFYGPGELAFVTGNPHHDNSTLNTFLAVWSGFYAMLAVVLYALTLLTFNSCLGRMPRHRFISPAYVAKASRTPPSVHPPAKQLDAHI